jgi:hypothetical protein
MGGCIDATSPGGGFAQFAAVEMDHGVDEFTARDLVELETLIDREGSRRIIHDKILQSEWW